VRPKVLKGLKRVFIGGVLRKKSGDEKRKSFPDRMMMADGKPLFQTLNNIHHPSPSFTNLFWPHLYLVPCEVF
jgi:hypothetical protein